MEIPPEITFRGLEKTEAIEAGVRYFPSEGEEGPQASSVQIVDKPGVRVPKT